MLHSVSAGHGTGTEQSGGHGASRLHSWQNFSKQSSGNWQSASIGCVSAVRLWYAPTFWAEALRLDGRTPRASGQGSGQWSQHNIEGSMCPSRYLAPGLVDSAVKSPASRFVPATTGAENIGLLIQKKSSSPKAESWSVSSCRLAMVVLTSGELRLSTL